MRQQLFERLYADAQRARDGFAKDPALVKLFDGHSTRPPVIGFGLPEPNSGPVRVATIAINPSSAEFNGTNAPLPDVDDCSVQWDRQSGYFKNAPYLEWFGPAASFLRASELAGPATCACPGHSCAIYRDGKAVHLDLTPLTTKAFDNTYDKALSAAERTTALHVLRTGTESVLIPLLRMLQAEHGLERAVIFGFVGRHGAKKARGNRSMKDLLRDQFSMSSHDEAGGMAIGWGLPRSSGLFSGLADLPFGFVSQGPSSWRARTPTAASAIVAAAERLRDLKPRCGGTRR
jgi:hypothetical protein